MATRFYFHGNVGNNEPKPNVKQNPNTITQYCQSTLGGGQDSNSVIYPLGMDTTQGNSIQAINGSFAEPGVAHRAWFKAWISPALTAQTLNGTFSFSADFNEGAAAHNMMPNLYIYIWHSNDTKGPNIFGPSDSLIESDINQGTMELFFDTLSIGPVTIENGDRIVVEVSTFDNNTKTNTYEHYINFNGNTGSGMYSYLEFSQNLTFSGQLQYQTVTSTEISSPLIKRKTNKIINKTETSTPSLIKQIKKTVFHPCPIPLSLGKLRHKKHKADEVSIPNTTKVAGKFLSFSEYSITNISKIRGKFINAVENTATDISKKVSKSITSLETSIANAFKLIPKAFNYIETSISDTTAKRNVLISFVEYSIMNIHRKTNINISHTETSITDVIKRITKSISSIETSVANLIKTYIRMFQYVEMSLVSLSKKRGKYAQAIEVSVNNVQNKISKTFEYIEYTATNIRKKMKKTFSYVENSFSNLFKMCLKNFTVVENSLSSIQKNINILLSALEISVLNIIKYIIIRHTCTEVSIPTSRKHVRKFFNSVELTIPFINIRKTFSKILNATEVGITSIKKQLRKSIIVLEQTISSVELPHKLFFVNVINTVETVSHTLIKKVRTVFQTDEPYLDLLIQNNVTVNQDGYSEIYYIGAHQHIELIVSVGERMRNAVLDYRILVVEPSNLRVILDYDGKIDKPNQVFNTLVNNLYASGTYIQVSWRGMVDSTNYFKNVTSRLIVK